MGMNGIPGLGGSYGSFPYGNMAGSVNAHPPGVPGMAAPAAAPRKSKGFLGAIKDVGVGVVKGGIHAVKGLFTVQGALMGIASALAIAFAAPIAIPALVTLGLGIGGYQIVKGATSGDWQKAGEGIFTVGATMLGARFGAKAVPADKTGAVQALSKTTGEAGAQSVSRVGGLVESTWANVKALFGGKVYHRYNADGALASAESQGVSGYRLVGDSYKARAAQRQEAAAVSAEAKAEGANLLGQMQAIAGKFKNYFKVVQQEKPQLTGFGLNTVITGAGVSGKH